MTRPMASSGKGAGSPPASKTSIASSSVLPFLLLLLSPTTTLAQQPSTAVPAGCFALSASSVCGPEYEGYRLMERASSSSTSPAYSTESQFNDWVNANIASDAAFASHWVNTLGCAQGPMDRAIPTLRFRVSFWCSRDVALSRDRCGNRDDGPMLCKDQCAMLSQRAISIIDDASICPATGNQNLSSQRTAIKKVYQDFCAIGPGAAVANATAVASPTMSVGSATPTTCSAGFGAESRYCGYFSESEAQTFCPTNPDRDLCCYQSYNGPAPASMSLSTTTTSATTTSLSTTLSATTTRTVVISGTASTVFQTVFVSAAGSVPTGASSAATSATTSGTANGLGSTDTNNGGSPSSGLALPILIPIIAASVALIVIVAALGFVAFRRRMGGSGSDAGNRSSFLARGYSVRSTGSTRPLAAVGGMREIEQSGTGGRGRFGKSVAWGASSTATSAPGMASQTGYSASSSAGGYGSSGPTFTSPVGASMAAGAVAGGAVAAGASSDPRYTTPAGYHYRSTTTTPTPVLTGGNVPGTTPPTPTNPITPSGSSYGSDVQLLHAVPAVPSTLVSATASSPLHQTSPVQSVAGGGSSVSPAVHTTNSILSTPTQFTNIGGGGPSPTIPHTPTTPPLATGTTATGEILTAPPRRVATVAAPRGAPLVMRIIHPYAPLLADELELHVGDEIVILRAFDDGWGLGVVPSTGAKGAFPLVCVSVAGSSGSDGSSNAGARASEQQRLSALLDEVGVGAAGLEEARKGNSSRNSSRNSLVMLAEGKI
ncbi:hypothetical protein HDU96_008134 [Phlyctochytrium bullatum]|nr:hypothetical protein HDU96_008134 [Phlyctochytrium bullatum]